MTNAKASPFLKWAGGKRSIMTELTSRVPDKYSAYREPFIGGGALFLQLQPSNASISDVNERLINTYLCVRDNVEKIIEYLSYMMSSHSKDNYYLRRADFNKEFLSDEANAALFIYLNKTGFNGIYRVNKDNKFNVPVGSKLEPFELDYENLRVVSTALRTVNISTKPFSDVQVGFRDFIYLDPPYHETYAGYSKAPFGEQDHELLADFCGNADKSGAYFMQSNSDTPFIRNLYEGYNIEIVSASRSISRSKEGRGRYDELLIRNY